MLISVMNEEDVSYEGNKEAGYISLHNWIRQKVRKCVCCDGCGSDVKAELF